MINRYVTRTVLSGVEQTAKTNSPEADTLSFVLTTASLFYIGFQGKFAARYFAMGTANTNASVISVEYWNGSAWAAVKDIVDSTAGFTKSGFLSWVNESDWQKTTVTPVTGVDLYWVRLSVSADLSAGTTLQACLNLYSSDNALRVYYPWLVSDSRFLPANRTNFLEQHVAAKDLVVKHLRDRHAIGDESQVIDIERVMPAAIHAAAYLILLPISTSPEMGALRDGALAAFKDEIGQTALSVDQNADGIVSNSERQDITSSFIMRR